MYWLKFVTVLVTTICVNQGFASEGGGGHEAPPAAEHGGGKAAAKKEVEYSGVQNDEWSKAQKDVQTAKVKFENDQKALEELKHAAEFQENLSKESLAKINEAKKTVKASEANYLRLLNLYNLRFPEKGLEVGRKYERSDSERDGIETVEEKPQGVEAKLRKLNRNIKRQYLQDQNANSASSSKKKKNQKKQGSDESDEMLPSINSDDVTGTITIEK